MALTLLEVVGDALKLRVTLLVAVRVWELVGVFACVGDADAPADIDAVTLPVPLTDLEAVRVPLTVPVALRKAVTLGGADGMNVGVIEMVSVSVPDGAAVAVSVSVIVCVCDGVTVSLGVIVGVGVGDGSNDGVGSKLKLIVGRVQLVQIQHWASRTHSATAHIE